MTGDAYLGGLESRGWMGPDPGGEVPVLCSCGDEHYAGEACPSCGEEPVTPPEGDEERA